MKSKLTLGGLMMLGLAGAASATIVVDNWNSGTLNAALPDGNPAGYASSTVFSGLDVSAINQVDVSLNISGGYNGDLYGYLVLQSADNTTTTSILLNRVGRNDASGYGFATSGMTVTLSGDTSLISNIHNVQTPGAGPYLADGRQVDPNGNFSGAVSTAGLDILNGHNANGTWTLFLADMANGDQSTLVSWGLNISVVPEPVTWALGIFGGVLGLGMISRWQRQLRRGV